MFDSVLFTHFHYGFICCRHQCFHQQIGGGMYADQLTALILPQQIWPMLLVLIEDDGQLGVDVTLTGPFLLHLGPDATEHDVLIQPQGHLFIRQRVDIDALVLIGCRIVDFAIQDSVTLKEEGNFIYVLYNRI